MSSLDDILATMKAAAPSAAAPPPSHTWTEEEPQSSEAKPPGAPPPLDAAHRVQGGEGLDYRFRCGSVRLSESEAAALCADCSMAFALNSSNWLAATAEPRCALERLARSIFEAHTAGVSFDAARSGAEWWAQVRGGGHRHEGIEFHWDVDEHLCDLPGGAGLHVHPHLSTVTYLTKVGAPTLVLDAGSPTAATRAAVSTLYGPIRTGALSYPRLGKTIVFDGAKLHGAVPTVGLGAPAGSNRVTFLVNVWLHHQPHAVEPLPSTLAASMRAKWRPHPQLGALAADLAPPPRLQVDAPPIGLSADSSFGGPAEQSEADAQQQQQHVLHVAFGRNDKVHALRVPLPPAPPAPPQGGAGGDSYRLVFSSGCGAALEAHTGGLKTDRSGQQEKARKRERGDGTAEVKKKKKKKRKMEAGQGGPMAY